MNNVNISLLNNFMELPMPLVAEYALDGIFTEGHTFGITWEIEFTMSLERGGMDFAMMSKLPFGQV
ncbi:hypothetical protein ACXX82_21015 [Glaciimonas sp. GNP009]